MKRGEWAILFAKALGNQNPSVNIIRWISAWTKAENPEAHYNPLATTRVLNAGETLFNSAGVKNYTSWEQGLQATVETVNLSYPGYAEIREGILQNSVTTAQNGLNKAPWGTNAALVATLFTAGNWSDEPLPSTPNGGNRSGGTWDSGYEWVSTPGGLAPMTPEQQREYERTGRIQGRESILEQTATSVLTEENVRAGVYIGGGALLLLVSALIAFRRLIPQVQQVERIAKALT